MDRARLIAHLRQFRFRTTAFRQGYDEGEVDAFLDDVATALLAGEPAAALVARVQSARFTPTSMRRGYDMADVDAALDTVVAAVEAERGHPAPPARTQVPEHAENAELPQRSEPTQRPGQTREPGLLTRVLRAVRGDQPLR